MQERCWESMINKEDREKIIRIILPTVAVLLAFEGIRYLSFFKTAYQNTVFRKAFFACIPLLIGISFLRIRKVLMASNEQPKIERFCKRLALIGYVGLAFAFFVLILV